MKSRIQAVTFDVGGTLIEPWPSVGHVYAKVAKRFGVSAEPAILNRNFHIAWKEKENFDYSREAWFGLVRQTFGAGSPLPEDLFPALYQRFAEPDAWRVFEDVLPAFQAMIDRGVRLGVISNWDERLEPLLRGLGLYKWFDAVVVSCQVRSAKPSPLIFRYALEKLGLAAASVLHVGDRMKEDVEGARAAGMRAVLIDRGLDGALQGAIRGMGELLPLIATD